MTRTIFAMAVAGLVFAAATATSQAAPMAPLPAGVTTTDHGTVTQVRWWYHRHHCWIGRWGHRHCW